jgi:hypothetical protein
MTGWTRSGFTTLASLCFFALSASPARAEDKCPTPPFDSTKTGAVVTITVDWAKLVDCTTNHKDKSLGARIGRRINDDNPVNIHLTEFNFINYTISYKVEETVVETYVMLEKLWQQLLGIPLFGAPTLNSVTARAPGIPQCEGFQKCGANWALKIATVNIVLNEYLAEFVGQTHVTHDNKVKIGKNDANLAVLRKDIRDQLDVILKDPKNTPSNIVEVTQFETVFAKQEKLFEKIDAYHAAAELVGTARPTPLARRRPARSSPSH